MSGCAWVTLATNDTYCLGALVLAHSLKKVSTRHQLAIIITPQVSPSMREQLSKVFDVVQLVDVLDSQDAANLALLQRPDLGVTFTKIHCWNLTQYSRCVFLDADTLVIQNCDELMEREELSAAPDPGWPDCFNSGVFVFSPSQETFKQLIQFASTHGSFDGGDQGLLNMYFNDWPTSDIRKHLSFLYNMCSTSTYTYLPALKYYGANIKIVHFIGANKPWLLGPSGAGMSTFNQAWWDTFQSSVVQTLSKDMSGLAGALGSKERSAIEEQWRKQNWEQGNIDFTGKDSFENIWQKIMDAVNKPKVETPKPVQPLVPKEIASQAISEKEKADLPENEVVKEDLAIETKEVQPPATDEKKDSAPVTLASVISELPPIPLTTSEASPKVDQPIPMPLPTPEKTDIPKPLESPKPLETANETPKTTAAEEPVIQMEAAIAQQEPIKLDEPKLDIIGDLPKIEDILKGLEQTLLAEQMKDEKKESIPAPPETPKIPTDMAQEQKKVEESQAPAPAEVPLPELPKTDAPKAEEPKPQTPEAPATATPQIEALPTSLPQTEAPPLPTPQTEAPTTPKPQTEAPPTPTSQTEAPTTPAPQVEAPLTPTPQTEAPPTPTPQTEAPPTPTPQAEAPPSPTPQTEVLPTPTPLAEAPTAPSTQSESPATPAPQPDTTVTSVPPPEVLKIETPKTEVPPPIGSPEVPKPTEAPKSDKPEAPKVESEQPILEGTPATAPEAKSDASSETKDVTPESKIDDGKKQKDGQKPAKQQAPQPPPKNGKQKKGQQPEPTSAHPLADMPVQADTSKEVQMLPQEPLTPPTSPDSQAKEPEPQVKAPELQPGTPTVTAPTPPVTPSDAFKVEDPLSAQIKSDEAASATGSAGGADAPVPPKRKGKANEKQPPKPQNNGAKGKGKK